MEKLLEKLISEAKQIFFFGPLSGIFDLMPLLL